jgi:hypothetical protein
MSNFNLKLAPGGVGLKAFEMTSTGATKFNFYAPTSSLGILLAPTSGTITLGQTISIYAKADVNQPSGTYNGVVYIDHNNTQTSTGITDTIIVDPLSADTDLDGFINDRENKIGTDANYACRTPVGFSAWPPDFDNDGRVGLADLSQISQRWNSVAGGSKYDKRYDLNTDGKIGLGDYIIIVTNWNKTCTVALSS